MTNDELARSCDLPDGWFIDRVRAGDTDAFRILILRHEIAVFRILRNLAPSHTPVADLAQDVFLAAFVNLDHFAPTRGSFSSWLFTIAKHHALNARKKRVALALEEVPEQTMARTPADDLDRRNLEQRLDAALARLPSVQRTAFVLIELVGLSPEQVAEIEHSPLPTIRSRLSRAKATLSNTIKETEDVP